jgi:hypothetical protein
LCICKERDVDLERITKYNHFQALLCNSNGNGDSHLDTDVSRSSKLQLPETFTSHLCKKLNSTKVGSIGKDNQSKIENERQRGFSCFKHRRRHKEFTSPIYE